MSFDSDTAVASAAAPPTPTSRPPTTLSADEAAALEQPGPRLYLIAMTRFFSGFSPAESPTGTDRPS